MGTIPERVNEENERRPPLGYCRRATERVRVKAREEEERQKSELKKKNTVA